MEDVMDIGNAAESSGLASEILNDNSAYYVLEHIDIDVYETTLRQLRATIERDSRATDIHLVQAFLKCVNSAAMEDTDAAPLITIIGSQQHEHFKPIFIPATVFEFFNFLTYMNYVWTGAGAYVSGIVCQLVTPRSLTHVKFIIDVDLKAEKPEEEDVSVTQTTRRHFVDKILDALEPIGNWRDINAEANALYSCKENSMKFHVYFNFMLDITSFIAIHSYLCGLLNGDEDSPYVIDMTRNISMPCSRHHRPMYYSRGAPVFVAVEKLTFQQWRHLSPYSSNASIFCLQKNDNCEDFDRASMRIMNNMNIANYKTLDILHTVVDLAEDASAEDCQLFARSYSFVELQKILKLSCSDDDDEEGGNSPPTPVDGLKFIFTRDGQQDSLGLMRASFLQHIFKHLRKLHTTVGESFASISAAVTSAAAFTDKDPIEVNHYYDIFNFSTAARTENLLPPQEDNHVSVREFVSQLDDNMDDEAESDDSDNDTSVEQYHIPRNINVQQQVVHYSDSCRFPFTPFQLKTLKRITINKLNPDYMRRYWDKQELVYDSIVEAFIGLKNQNINEDSLYLCAVYLFALSLRKQQSGGGGDDDDGGVQFTDRDVDVARCFVKIYIKSMCNLRKHLLNPKWSGAIMYAQLCAFGRDLADAPLTELFEDSSWLHFVIEEIINMGNVTTMIAFISVYNTYYTEITDIIYFILYNYKLSLHAQYILTKWLEINLDQASNHFARETIFNNDDFLLFSLLQLHLAKCSENNEKYLMGAFKSFKALYKDFTDILNSILLGLMMETDIGLRLSAVHRLAILFECSEEFEKMFVLRVLGTKALNEKTIILFSCGGYRQMLKTILDADFRTLITYSPKNYVPESAKFSFEFANDRIGLFNSMLQVYELNTPTWKTRVVMSQDLGGETIFQLAWQPEIQEYLFKIHCAIPHFIKRVHVDSLVLSLLLPVVKIPQFSVDLIRAVQSVLRNESVVDCITKSLPLLIDDLYPSIEYTVTLANLNKINLRSVVDNRYVFQYGSHEDARKPQVWPHRFKQHFLALEQNAFRLLFDYVYILLLTLRKEGISFKSLSVGSFIKQFFNFTKHKSDQVANGKTLTNLKTLFMNYFLSAENKSQDEQFDDCQSVSTSHTLLDYADDQINALSLDEYSVLNTWYYRNLPTVYESDKSISSYCSAAANESGGDVGSIMKKFYQNQNREANKLIDMVLADNEDGCGGSLEAETDDCEHIIQTPLVLLDRPMDLDDEGEAAVAASCSNPFAKIFSRQLLEESFFDSTTSLSASVGTTVPGKHMNSKTIQNFFVRYPFSDHEKDFKFSYLDYEIVPEPNLRLTLVILSWFIRMGDEHVHKNCDFFGFIRKNRRLLYTQLRDFVKLFNDNQECCSYENNSQLVEVLDNFTSQHTFSIDPEFKMKPLIPYSLEAEKILKIATLYANKTPEQIEEILALERANAKTTIIKYKKEILTLIGFLVVFAEYNYGVFVDLFKVLTSGSIKGNPHRRFALIVGITGGGKSTLLRWLEAYFTSANSSAKLSNIMISSVPKQDLDSASAPIASCLIGVSDELKQLNCGRINYLCDEGKIGSRAIRQTDSTQYRMTCTLVLASNKGSPVDDATYERIIPIIKNHMLYNAKKEHLVSINENSSDILEILDRVDKRFLNNSVPKKNLKYASRLAGLHCIMACVPYVYEETLVGMYINIMYGRLFFLNANLLPIDKDVSRPTLHTKIEYGKKYSPKIRFLHHFKIDTNADGVTSRSDFEEMVHLWWSANKSKLQMPDFDSNALLQLLEHEYTQYLTEDKNSYRFKITTRFA